MRRPAMKWNRATVVLGVMAGLASVVLHAQQPGVVSIALGVVGVVVTAGGIVLLYRAAVRGM